MINWLLSYFPESIFIWITYGMFGSGILLYIASKLTGWIPIVSLYKLPIEIIGVLLLAAGAYLFGRYDTEMVWKEKVKTAEERAIIAEKKAFDTNILLQEEIKKKNKVIIKVRTIIKKTIEEKRLDIDKACKVIPDVNHIHNSAALNKIPKEKK